MQTKFQGEKKNETQPSHVLVESPGFMQTVLGLNVFFSSFLHRKAVQMFREQACGFPVFLFLVCSRLSSVAKALPYSVLEFLFFPESGAPTGGSSPGQLQMRNSWPAALAAAQIRPFEKITVLLLLPPPPVGHARSAESRGMCRKAGGGKVRAK